MKEKKGLSISRKMSIIITLMIMVSTIAVGTLGFIMYRGDSITLGGERAMAIAKSMAAAIDGDDFTAAMASGEKTPMWERTKEIADGIAASTGTSYLYAVTADSPTGDTTYYVEGYNPAMGDDALDLLYTESATFYAEEMFETLNSGNYTSTTVYQSGDFGQMVSGFAPIYNSSGAVVGVVGADIGVDDVMEEVNYFGLRTILVVLGFCLAFGLVSMWIVNREIGDPIKALTAASEQIAKGNLDIDVSHIQRTDEIGALATAFSDMARRTGRQVGFLKLISEGDLTVDIWPRGEHDQMGHAMIKTVKNLNEIFGEIRQSSGHLSMASTQIAEGSQLLAQGSTEQSATVERLAESVGQIADKAAQNVEMAGKANALVSEIKEDAHKGATQMGSMVDAVRQIDEASHAIENVMKVIDDIAFQTNILALNAAVEAARAGEHGKGFAVVADEVRTLAAKSAASAKETGSLIENTIQKSALGVEIANATASSFDSIVHGINESEKLISAIADASNAQSSSIESINNSVAQVAEVVHQNSASAEESAASSEELNNQSDQLNAMLARFKLNEEAQGGQNQKALPR